MKKIIYFLVISILFFSGFKKETLRENEKINYKPKKNNILANSNSIRIAFFNVDPHVYLDEKKGKLTGAAYEMLENYIAPEMGIKFIWDKAPTAVPRQLETLKDNKNYAAVLLVATLDRLKIYDFSKKPYFLSQTAIAVLKDNKLDKVSNIEDIIGMRVGYAEKNFISPFMRDPKIKFDFISASGYHRTNLKKLLANRIDAVYAPDKAALLYLMKLLKLEKKIKVLNLPEKPSPFHVVFTKGSKDIVEKYNKAFDKLNGQTLYLNILKKYLDITQL